MNLKENKENFHTFISKEETKRICEDYVSSDIKDYEEFISKYKNNRNYLFLSNIGENLLSWYEFKENSNVLEISSDFGQITNVLLTNSLNVVKYEIDSVKNKFFKKRFMDNNNFTLKDIGEIEKDNKKYDYIIVSNVVDQFESSRELFKVLEEHLEKDGILIFIFENGNSINSFSLVDNKEGMLYMLNDNNTFTLSKLNKELEDNKLINKNVYYSFPNSYIPSVIYEDSFFVEKVKSVSYPVFVNNNDIIIANEEDMLNQVLKENSSLIKYFANSYIIEASRDKINKKSSMVSFNNYRKKKYTLATLIKDKKVYKLPRCEEANFHIDNMKKGIMYLKSLNKNFIDDIDEDGKIYSKYIDSYETLDKVIYKKYKENKSLEEISQIYLDSYKILDRNLKNIDQITKNELLEEIPQEYLENMKFLEICPWDMVAKNCFLINKEYYFFDQEWFEKSLPLEFLIYRSVINSYDLVKKIDVNELFKLLKIDNYIKYFENINNKLFNKVLDKEIHSLYINCNLKIDNLLYALKEVEIYKENIKGYIENNEKQNEYIRLLESQLEDLRNNTIKNKVNKFFSKNN